MPTSIKKTYCRPPVADGPPISGGIRLAEAELHAFARSRGLPIVLSWAATERERDRCEREEEYGDNAKDESVERRKKFQHDFNITEDSIVRNYN